MADLIKGAKISKPSGAPKVSVGGTEPPASEEAPAAETTSADDDFSGPGLTVAERNAALAELPMPPALEPRPMPTWLVKNDGRAWHKGQQIRLRKGDTFTLETWDESAVQGFIECGVQIERIG